jgi:hypothetical protein
VSSHAAGEVHHGDGSAVAGGGWLRWLWPASQTRRRSMDARSTSSECLVSSAVAQLDRVMHCRAACVCCNVFMSFASSCWLCWRVACAS